MRSGVQTRVRSQGWRLLVTAAALASGLAVLGLAAGCIPVVIDEQGTVRLATTQAHPDTSTAEATGAPAPSPVGAVKKAGSWQVTVTSAKRSSKGPGGAKAGSGKEFLLIETVFENTQMSTVLVVRPTAASLEGASGASYDEWGTAPGYNGRGMREIGPGLGGNTTWAYRVPKGSATYTFTFAPKVDGERVPMEWRVP